MRKIILILVLILTGFCSNAQERIIKGKVTDEKGIGISGASVFIKNTGIGTSCGNDGSYQLLISADHQSKDNVFIIFRASGFVPKEILVEGESDIFNITLVMRYEGDHVLDPVAVSANRFEYSSYLSPQNIEIIDEKEIKNLKPLHAIDLLKKASNVDVVEYPGLLGGLSIRGFSPKLAGLDQYVLYLIDGRPAGIDNLSTLDINQIERVEVLKGPASVQYGSGAMGGVVNFIRKRSEESFNGNLALGWGSFGTMEANVNVGGKIVNRLSFDAGIAAFSQSQNYKVGKKTLLSNPDEELIAQNIEEMPHSSYGYQSGYLRLRYDINDDISIEGNWNIYSAGDVQIPGSIWGVYGLSSKDVKRYGADLQVEARLNFDHVLTFKPYWSKNDNEFYDDEAGYLNASSSHTFHGFQLQDTWTLGGTRESKMVFGFDYQQAKISTENFDAGGSGISPYSPNQKLTTAGLFANALISIKESLIINAGVRYDLSKYLLDDTPLLADYQQKEESFGNLSANLGLLYSLSETLALHANVGRAFIAPNVFKKAGRYVSPFGGITIGNPELEPEYNLGWDTGLRWHHPRVKVDITYFQNHWSNYIVSVYHADENFITYENARKALIQGLEIGLSFELLPRLDFSANYTRLFNTQLEAEGPIAASTILGLRENKLNATISYAYTPFNKKWGYQIHLNTRYSGERLENNFFAFYDAIRPTLKDPVILIPQSIVFDGAATISYREHHLTLYVKNILDENYIEVDGYNMPGRNFNLQYKVNF